MATLDQLLDDTHRFEQIALAQIVCPQCEAKPQQECTTKGGNPAKAMHVSRYAPLQEAFEAGYQAGLPMTPQPTHTP